MVRMALTADGKDGWAIGNVVPENGLTIPMLWRYDARQLAGGPHQLSGQPGTADMTISADGKDGWMTAYDTRNFVNLLLRLQNGAWDYVTERARRC